MLAADGALSLKVASIGIPFRILSPKHGIFVNADACAFQSLLVKAVLSGEPEEFQDNLSHSANQGEAGLGQGAGSDPCQEASSIDSRCSSVSRDRVREDPLPQECGKRSRWTVLRADEKGLIWRRRNAMD
ncbi:hypothetical protein [Roseibium sp. MMSF_3412]|uniref:hypothetical protein n=1 Tax=Roseibium sp. MMSF_3412 TaxID=3046712 RepID=UPI00273D1B25|nr:hypothetical protein [Roseibium sp. MMSF_3412]